MLIWKIIVFLRLLLKKECKNRYQEKFAITKDKNNTNLETFWIHAVSVGEMNSIEILIKELSKKFFVLLTTTSVTSAKLAANIKVDNFVHQFNPVDWPFYVKKFLQYWNVKRAIFIESEFWPFTIYYTSKVANIYLINARFSDKSYKKWHFFRKIFFTKILNYYTKIFPSGNFSKERFESFGIKNIVNNINTKIFNKAEFCQKVESQKNIFKNLRIFISNKTVFSFISLHFSEISVLLQMMKNILSDKNSVILILPRKIHEAEQIMSYLCNNLNEEIDILNNKNEQDFVFNNKRILILNEMGISPFVYNASHNIFVCGSFIKGIGGHNPLESLFVYKKSYFGSFYEKNIDLVEELKSNNLINIIQQGDYNNLNFNENNNENKTNESFKILVDEFFDRKQKELNKLIEVISE